MCLFLNNGMLLLNSYSVLFYQTFESIFLRKSTLLYVQYFMLLYSNKYFLLISMENNRAIYPCMCTLVNEILIKCTCILH